MSNSAGIIGLPQMSEEELADMEGELRDTVDAERKMYEMRQGRIMQCVKDLNIGSRMVDGLGELEAVFDSRTYFRWEQEDKDFWQDEGNFKQYAKDNPDCLVKNWVDKPLKTSMTGYWLDTGDEAPVEDDSKILGANGRAV